jgi:serine/threonine protein kinase
MSDLFGRKFGDYELRSLLGKGNTGKVYKALRVSNGEAAAVKILHPEVLADQGARQRFENESERAAGLIHPGAVPIYHWGQENGEFYIAMEGQQEGSVFSPEGQDPVRQGPWESRLELVRQVAEILAAAHQRRVLHLDIHPGNILWSRSPRGPFQIKLSDFGLLRAVHEGISRDGELRGHPGYLAPEQWQGGEVDERTDIYAVGVLLYQTLTGSLPFPPSAPATAMYNHLYVDAPAPRRGRPDLPPKLEAIVLRCLAKKPRERASTMEEVSEALRMVIFESGQRPSQAALAHVAGAGTQDISLNAPPRGRMLQPPEPVAMPPEPKGPLGVPRFEVFDERGAAVSRGFLRSSGATIGSAADNVIVLESADVSPHHARIDWDGVRITITDLGSRTGTFLNDQRLLPQIAQEWTRDQQARIGSYSIRMQPPRLDVDRADVIDVIVEHAKRTMILTPGKPEECRVTIANHKTIVDHLTLSVAGIDPEWVRGTGVEIALNPYDKRDVVLTILVPKEASSTAGAREVVIRAESVANPEEPAEAKAHWTVAPFDGASLSVTPSKLSARKRGRYSVSLLNEGNRPASYSIAAADEDRELAFEFESQGSAPQVRAKISVGAGEKAALRLSAETAARRWLGSAVRRTFQIQATQHGAAETHTVEARFNQLPIITTWMIVAATIGAAGLVLVVPRLGRPNIRSVEIAPSSPRTGEAVTIVWDAAKARSIEIRPLKAGISPGQGSYRVANGFEKETVLTVIASNFFGSDQREISVIPVPPPPPPPLQPTQVVLSVSRAVITKGRSVTISWNVTGGSSAEFNLTGAVPLQGSYTDSPDKDQTYTITGYNAANLPTKKSITVKVIEEPPARAPKPQITVDKNLIHQGEFILLTWSAKGAKDVRIDSLSPSPLTGTSGQKQAKLLGKGRYTFTVVSANEAGVETKSDPVVVDVNCTFFQKTLKTCSDTPQIQWR